MSYLQNLGPEIVISITVVHVESILLVKLKFGGAGSCSTIPALLSKRNQSTCNSAMNKNRNLRHQDQCTQRPLGQYPC